MILEKVRLLTEVKACDKGGRKLARGTGVERNVRERKGRIGDEDPSYKHQ